jgi:hypothetical protein
MLVTEKGQVTIPRNVHRNPGIVPGSEAGCRPMPRKIAPDTHPPLVSAP